jgi:hypothetical protein
VHRVVANGKSAARQRVTTRPDDLNVKGVLGPGVGEADNAKIGDQVESIASSMARSAGLIVDGKRFKCPPGTPNALEFTDVRGSNCGQPSPKKVTEAAVHGAEGAAHAVEHAPGMAEKTPGGHAVAELPYTPGVITDPAILGVQTQIAKHRRTEIENSTSDRLDAYNEYVDEENKLDLDPKEVVDAVIAKARASVGAPAIQIDSALLPQVLTDGRFKNQFETGTSMGYFNPEGRRSAEQGFAVPKDLPVAQRPVYGMAWDAFDQDANVGLASGYGDTSVFLKKEAINQATVSFGDSIDSGLSGVSAKDIDSAPDDAVLASISSFFADNAIDDYIASVAEDNFAADEATNFFDESYIEMQFHGGVPTTLIDHVQLPYDLEGDPTIEPLLKQLKEAGISWHFGG